MRASAPRSAISPQEGERRGVRRCEKRDGKSATVDTCNEYRSRLNKSRNDVIQTPLPSSVTYSREEFRK